MKKVILVMKKDSRIDDYIKKSAEFAQPILIKLRELVHIACPAGTETLKWGMPSFEYKGPMFSFAAFKQHCVAGFWKENLIKDPNNYLGKRKAHGGEAMGNFGRMTSLDDLPPDEVIVDFIKQHMKLNDDGIKIEKINKPTKELIIPEELIIALEDNPKAQKTFEKFPPSQKREYAEWIIDAKTEDTKNKRLKQSIEWLEEGKPKNWKYMKEYQHLR
jgi:uncharacterized protein YdeI (YjbR/CyaY-like superfamily)